jgi:hypothetical protein
VFSLTSTKSYNLLKAYELKCGIKDHTDVSSIQEQYMNEELFTNFIDVDLNRNMIAKMTTIEGKNIVL